MKRVCRDCGKVFDKGSMTTCPDCGDCNTTPVTSIPNWSDIEKKGSIHGNFKHGTPNHRLH